MVHHHSQRERGRPLLEYLRRMEDVHGMLLDSRCEPPGGAAAGRRWKRATIINRAPDSWTPPALIASALMISLATNRDPRDKTSTRWAARRCCPCPLAPPNSISFTTSSTILYKWCRRPAAVAVESNVWRHLALRPTSNSSSFASRTDGL